jgi:cobalt-zinc-cadmium efflux system outer membrane protein
MADVGNIDGDLFQVLPNFDLKQLQRVVIARNADPQAAQSDIARAQWELERSVVEPIPNVTVMGGYQRQVSPVGLVGVPEQDQGVLEISCTIPLFDRNQGNIRAARAEISKARAGLRSVEIGLANKTAKVINEYRQARRQAEWYQELILPKARETVRVTQLLYSEGELTFLRLLEAQRILTETELSYVQSQGTRWANAAEIASLLQLEDFPLTMMTPAAIDLEFVKQKNVGKRQPPELVAPPQQ